MKQTISLVMAMFFLLIVGCRKADSLSQFATANNPSFTWVTGTPGHSSIYKMNSFEKFLRADYDGSSLFKIGGSNLPKSINASNVRLEKNVNGVWSQASSYQVVNARAYSDRIDLYVSSRLNSEPIPVARFRVNVGATSYTTPTFSVVPFIYTRQYHQCTWFVIKRLIELGYPPENARYSNINSAIDVNYVPKEHDILSWGNNVHQAFIEQVGKLEEFDWNLDKVTTYTLTITEANIAFTGNNFNTAPSTYVTKVKVRLSKGKKTFEPGFGIYRSGRKDGASTYKRNK